MRKLFSLLIFIPFLVGSSHAQNGRWETDLAPMPIEKWAHSACVVDGKIYVIGGLLLTDQSLYNSIGSSSVEVYNPETNTWDTTKQSMPTARGYCATGVIGNEIYICGGTGYNTNRQLDILEIYNTETDTWDTSKPPMPTGRFETKGAVLDGKFYVIGGLDNSNPELGHAFERFDPETNEWEILPDIPHFVGSCSADTLHGKIYVSGGIPILNNPTKYIQVYDPELNQWKVLDLELLFVSTHMGSCTVDDLIYIFGHGGTPITSQTNEVFPHVFIVDPINEVIHQVTEVPTERALSTAHLINNKVYVVGGITAEISALDWEEGIIPKVEVYTPERQPIYPYNLNVNRRYLQAEGGIIHITSRVVNSTNSGLLLTAYIVGSDSIPVDSIQLMDDGSHFDEQINDRIYTGQGTLDIQEGFYSVAIKSYQSNANKTFYIPNIDKLTTAGPVEFNGVKYFSPDTVPDPGDRISFRTILKNCGNSATLTNIEGIVTCLDSFASFRSNEEKSFGNIAAGGTTMSNKMSYLSISSDCPDGRLLDFCIDISSDNNTYWRDTFQIEVGKGFIGHMNDILQATDGNISVFPIPTTDIISITGLTRPALVKLYSLQGRLVKTTGQVDSSLDISELQNEVYVIQIETHGTIHRQRIIKH